MTGKQRVEATFEGRPVDKVPIYCAGLSCRIASHVLGREAWVGHGMNQYRESVAMWEGEAAHQDFVEHVQRDVLDVSEKLDLDLVRPMYWRYPREPIKRIDENTFMFGDEDADWYVMHFEPELELYQETDRNPRPEPTIEDIRAQVEREEEAGVGDPPSPDSYPDLQRALEYYGDRRMVPGFGTGVGIQRERHWLEAMALEPELVARHLMHIAKRNANTVQTMSALGLRVLLGGGDFAGNTGPMYSPKAFHQCMLPALQVVSEACEKLGVWHFFASDGNLWPVAEDLFGNSGVHGYYEIDRRCEMDLERLRDTFPELRLMGGLACATLHLGTPEEVRAEALDALRVAKERGRIVVGVSNQVLPPTPFENFDMMMDTLHGNQ